LVRPDVFFCGGGHKKPASYEKGVGFSENFTEKQAEGAGGKGGGNKPIYETASKKRKKEKKEGTRKGEGPRRVD